ncbi:hypothetical protein RHMOL_Rhmol10G0007200 [Rhododendron molle]|uniref:Uncharacterized protein n=1 Tax=Rhododendron molle TaxID=49168 RepID=A0ACC0LXU5_RHOML|nr:hypothetical protein RHMOL_Rhmol10G0007200 [Rhododendron molle]
MLKTTAMMQSPDIIINVKEKHMAPSHFSGSSTAKLPRNVDPRTFWRPEKTREPAGFAKVRKLYKAPNFFKPNNSEAAAGTIAQCAP